jgi:tetratricopeptide (TPR) repeat protein
MLLICVAALVSVLAAAQQDEAANANALYNAGRRPEALPLYEDLVKAHPSEWLYSERLADCLGAKATQSDDPAEVKALRTRERDAARRAIELGDPNYFAQLMAKIDPNGPVKIDAASPGGNLLQQGEKAFTTGDYRGAYAKYIGAAEADPKLYVAPLFAGDTAYQLKDLKTAGKWFAQAIAVTRCCGLAMIRRRPSQSLWMRLWRSRTTSFRGRDCSSGRSGRAPWFCRRRSNGPQGPWWTLKSRTTSPST